MSTSWVRCAVILAAAGTLLHPSPAVGQVSGEVEIRNAQGRALVRNTFRSPVGVEVALWESDETGERVELLRKADAHLWPVEFRLQPGETQVVRFLLKDGAYPEGTLLRLETRFTPVRMEPVAVASDAAAVDGVQAHLRIVTRILSKVRVK